MIVTMDNLGGVLSDLSLCSDFGLDTETYGLEWNDKMFSLIIATDKDAYYFNFKNYDDGSPLISKHIALEYLSKIFAKPDATWFIHNAKFDMRRLDIEGRELGGTIWDTASIERFVRNNYLKYSLDECLKRRGRKKDDKVEEYIKSHAECRSSIKVPGKKQKEKYKHYDKVPFGIIYEYGLVDANSVLFLGKNQRDYFARVENASLRSIVENETHLTRAVFNMEKRGVCIDVAYCRRAITYEEGRIEDAYRAISQLSTTPYKPGPKWLAAVLDQLGVPYELSEKGNPVFGEKALRKLSSPLVEQILSIREHEKNINFYSTFIHLVDANGFVHADYKIGGTDTGRFSCSRPNMQQLPKKEKKTRDNTFTVREAVVPRKNCILVMMDYDAMEYRLVADYAGQLDMIASILEGLDPHSHVAKEMGIADRDPAKTLNFMKVYGGGLAKLAMALFKPISNETTLKLITKRYIYESKKMSTAEILKVEKVPHDILVHDIKLLREAEILEKKYEKALPKLKPMVKLIKDTCKRRGFIFNRYGRRSYLDNESFVYAMLNYLIQGTGADVVKHAMVKIDAFLADKKSKMIAQVHDEILYEIDLEELHLIPELRKIMEEEYKPLNGMTLSVGVEWSEKSWAVRHRKKGIPLIENVREALNGKADVS